MCKASLADCQVLFVVSFGERNDFEVIELFIPVAIAKELLHLLFVSDKFEELNWCWRQTLQLHVFSDLNLGPLSKFHLFIPVWILLYFLRYYWFIDFLLCNTQGLFRLCLFITRHLLPIIFDVVKHPRFTVMVGSFTPHHHCFDLLHRVSNGDTLFLLMHLHDSQSLVTGCDLLTVSR